MMNEYQTEIDPLAIGLTRPPVFMGVNIKYFFANVIGSSLFCIDAHTLWGIPLFFILHFFMVKTSIKEPNFIYLWCKAFFQTPHLLNFGFWGKTNSYEAW
jgi:type IV secretion system protein VirB3